MTNLNKCCEQHPTLCVPMTWGAKQIDPELSPYIECKSCNRIAHGKTEKQASDNWNALEVPADNIKKLIRALINPKRYVMEEIHRRNQLLLDRNRALNGKCDDGKVILPTKGHEFGESILQ